MSENEIVVPRAMRVAVSKAVHDACGKVDYHPQIRIALEASVRWLYDEMDRLERKPYDDAAAHSYNACLADVRSMFLAPESEVPEEIKDLLEELPECGGSDNRKIDAIILEAYRRGQKEGSHA